MMEPPEDKKLFEAIVVEYNGVHGYSHSLLCFARDYEEAKTLAKEYARHLGGTDGEEIVGEGEYLEEPSFSLEDGRIAKVMCVRETTYFDWIRGRIQNSFMVGGEP